MTTEADIFTALKTLAGNRVFPDVAPLATVKPYVTYSQIGGEAPTFLERAVPSKKNGRFQFNVWGNTRAEVSALMLQIEAALVAATAFQAQPLGAASSTYDHDMLLYGSMQDFSIWSDR